MADAHSSSSSSNADTAASSFDHSAKEAKADFSAQSESSLAAAHLSSSTTQSASSSSSSPSSVWPPYPALVASARNSQSCVARSSCLRWTVLFNWEMFEPSQIVTSYFMSPLALFILRIIGLIYVLFVLGWSIQYTPSYYYLVYMTNLSYIGFCGVLLANTIWSGVYVFGKTLPPRDHFATKALYIVNHIQLPIHLCVVLVFWLLLSPNLANRDPAERFSTISQHGIEFFWTFVILMTHRIPAIGWPVIIQVLIALFYLFYGWMVAEVVPPPANYGEYNSYKGDPRFYVYPFLNYRDRRNGPIYILLLILFIVAYYIGMAVTVLRDVLGRAFWRCRGKPLDAGIEMSETKSSDARAGDNPV